MISIFVPVLYMLAGCSLLAAVHHSFLAMRSVARAQNLLFAVAALSITVFTCMRAASLSTDSISDLVNFRRVESIAVVLTFMALTWFFALFTQIRGEKFLLPMTGLWLLMIVVAIVRPYGIHFDEPPAQLHYVQLPWGETIVDLGRHSMSKWLLTGWLLLAVSLVFCFCASVRRALRVGWARTSPTLAALCVFSLLVFNNLAVNFELVPFIHTSELAFPALILMMHYRVASDQQTARRQMYDILDHLPIGFSQKDIEGNYLFFNSTLQSLSCDEHHVLVDDTSIFGAELADRFRATEQQLIKTGAEVTSEYVLEYSGTKRTIRLLQFPVTDIDGQRTSVCSLHIDITHERETEEVMRRMRLQLWRADRLSNSGAISKSLAHELSQPLTAILNNAQAALRFMDQGTMDVDELSAILKDIVSDDKRAGAVINNLRDMLQNLDIPYVTLSLDEVLREAVSFLHTELIEHAVDLQLELDHSILVHANRTQLQQVVVNLIMNAVEAMEHNDRSHVLRLRAVKQADTVLVSLADNGPGIAPDKLETVFEGLFTTKPNGLGIGLEVCRAIINAHGGRIWAMSNNGPGVTFSFLLPLAANT